MYALGLLKRAWGAEGPRARSCGRALKAGKHGGTPQARRWTALSLRDKGLSKWSVIRHSMRCSSWTGRFWSLIQRPITGSGSSSTVYRKARPSPHGLDDSLTLHGPDGDRWSALTTRTVYAARGCSGSQTPGAQCPSLRVSEHGDAAGGFLERGRRGAAGKGSVHMSTLKVGIASAEDMKARTMAIARGELKPAAGDPKCGSPRRRASPRYCRTGTAPCWR